MPSFLFRAANHACCRFLCRLWRCGCVVSWQRGLAEALESRGFTNAVVCLLALDVCVVFVELLFLDGVFGDPETNHHVHDAEVPPEP